MLQVVGRWLFGLSSFWFSSKTESILLRRGGCGSGEKNITADIRIGGWSGAMDLCCCSVD